MSAGRRRRVLVALTLSLGCAAATTAWGAPGHHPRHRGHHRVDRHGAGPRGGSPFVGMLSSQLLPYGPATPARGRLLARMRRAGVGSVRINLTAPYPLDNVDAFVLQAARHGIRVLPLLIDATHLKGDPGPGHGFHPPRRLRAFRRYAATVVRRYGPQGTLWRGRPPWLRRYAFHTYQIWNEPNLPVFWQPRPNPVAYARMVKALAQAIHRLDRHARIMTAGVPNSRLSKPYTYASYLRRFLRAGGARAADIIAVHGYSHSVADLRRQLRTVRSLVNHHRGRRLKMSITEIGWADAGHPNPFVLGGRGQARMITRSYRLIRHLRWRYRITGVFYYTWEDHPVGDFHGNTWGYHTGLVKLNGRAKPALRAFERAVRTVR